MAIRILPPEIASQIAAGEVVERPASVVKELLENSLDAQASEIKIEILEAGRRRIEIADNDSRHAVRRIVTAVKTEDRLPGGFRNRLVIADSR